MNIPQGWKNYCMNFVSTNGKSAEEAKTIHNYIKETTLTTYIEGQSSIRGVVKTIRDLVLIAEAIRDSLEEDKIY